MIPELTPEIIYELKWMGISLSLLIGGTCLFAFICHLVFMRIEKKEEEGKSFPTPWVH